MKENNGLSIGGRLTGLLLIVILAICAYAGAEQNERTVSVSAVRTSYAAEPDEMERASSAAERSKKSRDTQIALLKEVIGNEQTDQEKKSDAIRLLGDMAERSAIEAQVLECLDGMGIKQADVICGVQMLTVILSESELRDSAQRTRIFDAVSELSGYEAGDVKIIIAKK